MTTRSARAYASTGSCVTSSRTPSNVARWRRRSRRTSDARAGVERGERLVEQQQAGLGRQRSGQGDTLRLAARQRARTVARRGRRGRPARATPIARARASALATPRARSPKATFSSAVRLGTGGSPGTRRRPAVARAARTRRRRGRRGARRRARCVRRRSAAARRGSGSAVVLPEPFGPRTAIVSPPAGADARRRAANAPSVRRTCACKAHGARRLAAPEEAVAKARPARRTRPR